MIEGLEIRGALRGELSSTDLVITANRPALSVTDGQEERENPMEQDAPSGSIPLAMFVFGQVRARTFRFWVG